MNHKELIARLKVGASIERERVVYSGWAPLADEAAEAIEAIQAENDRIQTGLQNSITRRQEQMASADFAVASLKSERDTLRQQLAEARRDADRYRWLRDNCSYSYGMQPNSPAEHGIEYQWQQGTYEERDHGINGTIDAAIAAMKAQHDQAT